MEKFYRAAVLLLVVMVGCFSARADREVAPKADAPPKIVEWESVEQIPLVRELTAEGMEPAAVEWGMVTLTQYYELAIHCYPIASLRERLHGFIHPKEGVSPSIRTVFEIGVEYDPRAHKLAVAYYTDEGEPVLELNAIPLYHHWLEMKDAEGAFLDFLVLVMLHEQFHLQEQELDLRFDMEGKTQDEIAALENAAYLDGARNAQTMREEGRAPVEALNPLIHGLWAYVFGGDDLTHPIWVQYGRLITNRSNTFVELLAARIDADYQE